MKCSNCGYENKEGAFFCAGCGTRIEATREIVEEQPQPQPEVQPQPQPEAQPQPEPQPEVQPQPQEKPDHTVKGRTFGIIGFILSIQAILLCLLPIGNMVALVYSIVGIIFAAISRKNVEFKLSRVGNILSIISLVFSVITIILYIVLFSVLVNAVIQNGAFDFGDFAFDIGKEGFIINIG